MNLKKIISSLVVAGFCTLFFGVQHTFAQYQGGTDIAVPSITIKDGGLDSSNHCHLSYTVDFHQVDIVHFTGWADPDAFQIIGTKPELKEKITTYSFPYISKAPLTDPKGILAKVIIPAGLIGMNKIVTEPGKKDTTKLTGNVSGREEKQVCISGGVVVQPTTDNKQTVPSASSSCVGSGEEGQECVEGKWICVPRPTHCCGVSLLTNVPFIGKCIVLLTSEEIDALKAAHLFNVDPNTITITETEAFPRLVLGLTKILITVILLSSFIAIVVAGVMIAMGGANEGSASKGKELIGSVIAALALLGTIGVILRLINPNFFG